MQFAEDVTEIDLDSLVLTRSDGVGGAVTPIIRQGGKGVRIADVATPLTGELCVCHRQRHDDDDDDDEEEDEGGEHHGRKRGGDDDRNDGDEDDGRQRDGFDDLILKFSTQ